MIERSARLSAGWIGVDLDGTLARYDGWKGPLHVGEPIPLMVSRVRGWLKEGRLVKVFTARIAEPDEAVRAGIVDKIQTWCEEHCGERLAVTNVKDYAMVELWDDRAVQVVANTGLRVDGG